MAKLLKMTISNTEEDLEACVSGGNAKCYSLTVSHKSKDMLII